LPFLCPTFPATLIGSVVVSQSEFFFQPLPIANDLASYEEKASSNNAIAFLFPVRARSKLPSEMISTWERATRCQDLKTPHHRFEHWLQSDVLDHVGCWYAHDQETAEPRCQPTQDRTPLQNEDAGGLESWRIIAMQTDRHGVRWFSQDVPACTVPMKPSLLPTSFPEICTCIASSFPEKASLEV